MSDFDAANRCGERRLRPTIPVVVAWLGMARILQRTERVLAAHLSCHRLNAGQLDVLVQIAADEGLTQRQLAERLCHSKANVSQLLDKMETAGLVRREPDGRAFRLLLTAEGRHALGIVAPEVDRLIADQFAPLTAEEQAEYFRLVGKLETATACLCAEPATTAGSDAH